MWHSVVLCCHDDRVQQDTDRDKEVKQWLWGNPKENRLDLQPGNKQTTFTAVVATVTIPVYQFTFFGGLIIIIFHWKAKKEHYIYLNCWVSTVTQAQRLQKHLHAQLSWAWNFLAHKCFTLSDLCWMENRPNYQMTVWLFGFERPFGTVIQAGIHVNWYHSLSNLEKVCKTGSEAIKLFSCSSQLSMNFFHS